MNDNPCHNDLKGLLTAYVDGELSPEKALKWSVTWKSALPAGVFAGSCRPCMTWWLNYWPSKRAKQKNTDILATQN